MSESEADAGYGQYGKTWLSDTSSLLFSLSIPLNAIEPMQVGNMSGVIALSIREGLEEYSSDATLKVKWPNDIHNNQGKVSGCLIELVKSADGSEWIAVIGIGINRANVEGDLAVGWIDPLDEEGFLKKLSSDLVLVFQQLRDNKSPFSPAVWQSNDYFSVGESVFVYDSGTQLNGLYEGVNSEGYACVRMNDEIKQYASGTVSIRKANEKE